MHRQYSRMLLGWYVQRADVHVGRLIEHIFPFYPFRFSFLSICRVLYTSFVWPKRTGNQLCSYTYFPSASCIRRSYYETSVYFSGMCNEWWKSELYLNRVRARTLQCQLQAIRRRHFDASLLHNSILPAVSDHTRFGNAIHKNGKYWLSMNSVLAIFNLSLPVRKSYPI